MAIRSFQLAAPLILAAVAPLRAQDTLTAAQIASFKARYAQALHWEIPVQAGTRLDSLRMSYERRLQRITAATDTQDRSPYPLWYRAYLRERWPELPKAGPYQYPRVAAQLLEWMAWHPDLRPGRARLPGRSATVGTNINASNVSAVHSESFISADYNHPDHLVAASNNITGSGRLKIFFTSDGGNSWNSTELPLNDGAAFHSDPAVAWAPDGAAWAATLGIDAGGSVRVQMYRSPDGGATWSFVKTVSTGGNNDKELMWIDTHASSPRKGAIYVAWDQVGAGMRFARSTDNGATWSSVMTLSSDAAIGAHLTTGPSGELYVAWPDVNSRQIQIRRSNDGGATFGAAQRITTTHDQFDISIPAMCRRKALVYVTLGVDRSAGPRRGNVYAVWTDLDGTQDPDCGGATSAANSNVYFSRSTNGGTAWSTPVRVHSDPARTDQFNPWMDVDPENGDIHVVYYDTRGDGGRSDVRLFHARSTDGGTTWTDEAQVATAPTDETTAGADDGNQFGDYNGLAVFRGVAHPSWTDRRTGTPGGHEQVFTARVSVTGGGTPPPAATLALELVPNGALNPGETATARATLTRGGAPAAGEPVLFATQDPDIASVSPASAVTNSAGVAPATVKALRQGQTTVTAAAAGQVAAAAVRVPTMSLLGITVLALALSLLAVLRLRPRPARG